MQSLWVVLILGSLVFRQVSAALPAEENEFAEFEVIFVGLKMQQLTLQEFDDSLPTSTPATLEPEPPEMRKSPPAASTSPNRKPIDDDAEDAMVEDEADEDFDSSDDFEGDGTSTGPKQSHKTAAQSQQQQSTQLKFADVPAHLRNNWSNYQVEILMLVALVVYLINYVIGKQCNQTLATQWFEAHQELLQEQFSLVGDDGTDTALTGRSQFVKETDSTISLWCSGRQGVLGMLVQMKLLKRQDLISVVSQLVRPRYDHVVSEMRPSAV